MNIFNKKIMLILLVAATTLAIFSACDEDDDIQATTASNGETDSGGNDKTARIAPTLPDYDWQGYIFKIPVSDLSGTTMENWQSRDITSEEATGDPINDAVYRRNMVLQNKYNFGIERVFVDNPAGILGMLRNAIAAGDNQFDCVSISLFGAAMAATEGLFADLFEVEYLDFEKPWWDKNAIEGISIGNRLFFASGDCVLANKDACAAILFNKPLLADLALENPYDLVKNNKWTIGKLYEMSRAAAADLNGNGKMDSDSDRFGFIPNITLDSKALYQGMGVRIAAKDADDLPFLTYMSERTFNIIDIWNELLHAKFTWHPYVDIVYSGDDMAERVFADGRGLFFSTVIRSVEHFRSMDTDFGILPVPWLDENQRKWYHGVDYFVGQAIAVPAFLADDYVALDRAGFMIEAITSESKYTVIPAYYDVQLTGKFIRDDESSEMLDIIFGSTLWDPGIIYDWFELLNGISFSEYSTPSGYEKRIGKIETAMQKTIDAFAKLN